MRPIGERSMWAAARGREEICAYFEITRDASTARAARLRPLSASATSRCCGRSTSAAAASARTCCATRSHARAARTCARSSRPATSCSRRQPAQVDGVVAGACRRLRPALGAEPVVMVRSAAEIARLLRQRAFRRHGRAGDRQALHRVSRRPARAAPAAAAPPAEGGARPRARVEARVLGGEPPQAERLVRLSRRLRRDARSASPARRGTGPR